MKQWAQDGVLWLIVLVAFILRVTGIGFGLYHPDEPLVVHHALAFGSGDLNPHMFYYPTFFLYLLFFLYGLIFVGGSVLGFFNKGPDDFLALYVTRPEFFYVAGRFLSVFFGTACVVCVYEIARGFWGKTAGRWAALFLAVAFLHGRDSHFVTVDVAMTFWVFAGFVFFFRYLEEGKLLDVLWGAFCAGAAIATKYNAAVMVLPFLLGWILKKPRSLKVLAGGLATAAAAFFICSPFVILDAKNALGFISNLRKVNEGFSIGPTHHALMLFYSTGMLMFFLSMPGWLRLLKEKKAPALCAASFILGYYYLITSAGQPFERYVLPLVPWCAILASGFVASRKNSWFLFAGLATSVLAAAPFIYMDTLLLKKDTRDLAKAWIELKIPTGSVVALDDPMLSPKLNFSKRQLREKIAALRSDDPHLDSKTKRLERIIESKKAPAYQLFFLNSSPELSRGFSLASPLIAYDVAALEEAGTQYVVTSREMVAKHPLFYRDLEADYDMIQFFESRQGDKAPGAWQWTYMPIDFSLWDYHRAGPNILIYRKKGLMQ